MSTKTIFLSLAIICGTFVYAQEKKAHAKKPAGAAQSSSGACYADKNWKLYKIEKFGQEKDPTADMKNDFLQLKGDLSFKIMYKGIEKFGTYTKGGILQLKMADGSETWPFKVISCDGTLFKTDYRDGDTHNILTYKAE
jgi:hypothetical protein